MCKEKEEQRGGERRPGEAPRVDFCSSTSPVTICESMRLYQAKTDMLDFTGRVYLRVSCAQFRSSRARRTSNGLLVRANEAEVPRWRALVAVLTLASAKLKLHRTDIVLYLQRVSFRQILKE